MKIIYSRSHAAGAYAIEGLSRCRWSHFGLLEERAGTVIEAVFLGGVVQIPLQVFIARAAARSQLGKPYDRKAIAGVIFYVRDWHEVEAWFCSELVE